MNIAFPAVGSFQTVDGIKFEFRTDLGHDRCRPGWSAGALARPVMMTSLYGSSPAVSGGKFCYRVGLTKFHPDQFVRACLLAIKLRKMDVAEARILIAKYDEALA